MEKQLFPVPYKVDIHPMILLSVIDHFSRVNKDTMAPKRVIGLLLGSTQNSQDGLSPVIDIHSSFAVPFSEQKDSKDIWFLDISYAEEMFNMQKKIMPNSKIVGWYSTEKEIQANDMAIQLLIAERLCKVPIFTLIKPDTNLRGMPVTAYTVINKYNTVMSTESAYKHIAMNNHVVFRSIRCDITPLEAEHIGIEHLLKDVADYTKGPLQSEISTRVNSLEQLEKIIEMFEEYVSDVHQGLISPNQEVLAQIQLVLSLLPYIHSKKTCTATAIMENDQHLSTWLGSIGRTILILYELINNRRQIATKNA